MTSGAQANFLTPEGWFEDTDREGAFVWSPPPAAADVVVERLGIAKHKRPNSLHLVVVPRLMTGRWRKHHRRATDCCFEIKRSPVWDTEEHFEPLLVFVSLPFLPHRPLFKWRQHVVEKLQGLMQEGGMHSVDHPVRRNFLRELLTHARTIPSL